MLVKVSLLYSISPQVYILYACDVLLLSHAENLIGNISSAIPDPPFLQEDGYLPADMAAALMNGEAPSTNSSRDNSGMQVAVPQQTLLLTTDEDTLD